MKALTTLFLLCFCVFQYDSVAKGTESLKLDNKIPVTIIQSQPKGVVNIALYVKAGHLFNGTAPGTAHLVEHLFNVSNTHGDPAVMDKLLASYGGERRATTNTTAARYWYQINNQGFEQLSELIADSLAGLNVSESALLSQLSAIENEWLQKNDHQQLINWEQSFRTFAHPSQKSVDSEPFFMGNKETFGTELDLIRERLEKHFSRYSPDNIKLVVASELDRSKVFSVLNNTIGKIRFKNSLNTKFSSNTVQLSFTPTTELRPIKKNADVKSTMTFAVTENGIHSVYAEFLLYLLTQDHQGSFKAQTIDATKATNVDVQFVKNAFHSSHALTVSSQFSQNDDNKNRELINEVANYVFTYLAWLSIPSNSASVDKAYTNFRLTRLATCLQPNSLSYEAAANLDNSIFFAGLDSFLAPCALPDSLNFQEFQKLVTHVVKMPLYTVSSVPKAEFESAKAEEMKVAYYPLRYKLVPTVKPNIIDDAVFTFPKKNLWLDRLSTSEDPLKEIDIYAYAGNKQYATNSYLLDQIDSLEKFAISLILETYLQERLTNEFKDAQYLGSTIQFKRDKGFRFTVTGQKNLVVPLSNDLYHFVKNRPIVEQDFNHAKAQTIRDWSNKAKGNQIYRVGSYLERLIQGQSWSQREVNDALLKVTPHRASAALKTQETQPDKVQNRSVSMTARHRAPANVLTSLYQVNDDSLKVKMFALMINAIIKAEFKDHFRNKKKLAYTAVTDTSLSDFGSGLVTLLQTSTLSIDDMKKSTSEFMRQQYKRIKATEKSELAALFNLQKQKMKQKAANPDTHFTDSTLSRSNSKQIEKLEFSSEEFLDTANQLLNSNQRVSYISLVGLEK